MAVGQFLELAKNNIVREWSIARDPDNINAKLYSTVPDYSLEDITKSYQWIQKRKTVQSMKISIGINHHFIASSNNSLITKEKVDQYLKTRNELNCTLDELIENESMFWCVILYENEWKSGSCSCPYFAKN